MPHAAKILKEYSQRRSELKSREDLKQQLHLTSKEAKDAWEELVIEWDNFLSRTEFDKTAEEVGESARQIGLKLKSIYDNQKKQMT
jgi:hypothetical protein